MQLSVGPVEQVLVPGDDVTVYLVMAVPPFVGAVQVTVALLIPRVALGFAGAEGRVAGVTAVDAAEGGDVPTPLVALTVKVYAVPLVSVVTLQLSVEREAGAQVLVPGDDVTV